MHSTVETSDGSAERAFMQLEVFNQQVEDLASSLGDATRRGIYISIREAAEAMTTAEVAELFDIHPNVARHHLHRLAEDGYLNVTEKRPEGRKGPGAGRPAKHYTASSKEVQLQFPARRYDLLSELLVRVIQRLGPDEASAAAEEVGWEYGQELATEIGLPEDSGFEAAARAVARAMIGMGFDTEANKAEHMLVTTFCPFGTTAVDHPEIVCKLDQGIVKGLLAATNQKPLAIVTPHGTHDEECFTDVPPS